MKTGRIRTRAWAALSLAAVSLATVVTTGRLDPGHFSERLAD